MSGQAMEYLALGVGILSGIIALILLFFITKSLFRFGKYIKKKCKIIWGVYIGFWTLVLLTTLVIISGAAVEYFLESKRESEYQRFVVDNETELDLIARKISRLHYQDTEEFATIDISDYRKCITEIDELSNVIDSQGVDIHIENEINKRVNIIKDSNDPWNTLDEATQNVILREQYDCERQKGLLTQEDYQLRIEHLDASKRPKMVEKQLILDYIEALKYEGLSDRKIVEKLFRDDRFSDSLNYLKEEYEIAGYESPVHSVATIFGLNYSSDMPRYNMKKFDRDTEERRESLEESMKSLEDSINSSKI